jgi:hypothetical protein
MLQRADDRTANVRTIAARIAKQAEGLSVREFLDACALASGTLIRVFYRGRGVDVAIERHNEALRRSVRKETP